MKMPTPILKKTSRAIQDHNEICDGDRALLIEALKVLLRERLRALEIIRDVGSDQTRSAFVQDDFGIADILRLARTLDRHARL